MDNAMVMMATMMTVGDYDDNWWHNMSFNRPCWWENQQTFLLRSLRYDLQSSHLKFCHHKMTVCSHHSNPLEYKIPNQLSITTMFVMFISMSYLKSLNPLLFKNITNIGSLKHFGFVFICVFVSVCVIDIARWQLTSSPTQQYMIWWVRRDPGMI